MEQVTFRTHLFPSAFTSKCDGGQSKRPGNLKRFQDIWGAAAGADPHQDVARFAQSFHLAGKDILKGRVVADTWSGWMCRWSGQWQVKRHGHSENG